MDVPYANHFPEDPGDSDETPVSPASYTPALSPGADGRPRDLWSLPPESTTSNSEDRLLGSWLEMLARSDVAETRVERPRGSDGAAVVPVGEAAPSTMRRRRPHRRSAIVTLLAPVIIGATVGAVTLPFLDQRLRERVMHTIGMDDPPPASSNDQATVPGTSAECLARLVRLGPDGSTGDAGGAGSPCFSVG